MTRWHQSGTRRDACALLYEAGECTAQQLKTRVESHYDARIEPRRFHALLEKLVKAGHVEKRTEGLVDRYSLTEVGEEALLEQYEWLSRRIENGETVEENGT